MKNILKYVIPILAILYITFNIISRQENDYILYSYVLISAIYILNKRK